tara:strand:+ start:245 stop:502 length:258 start_codon:yes stop_codon:yes gene_type:complete
MRLTKRQLKRIIKEEKAKLIKEQNPGSEFQAIQDTIDGWAYRSEEELNGQLSQIDRRWNGDPEVIDAILEALDLMKANFIEWGKQ